MNKVIKVLLNFSIKYSIIILLLFLGVTAFFAYQATKVKINPDVEGMVSEQDEIAKLIKKYGHAESEDDHVVVTVTAEDPFLPEKLQALEQAIEEFDALEGSSKSINPFNMLSFHKDGKRLEVQTMSPGSGAPDNYADALVLKKRLLADPFARNFVVSEDGKTLSVLIPITSAARQSEYIVKMNDIIAELEEHYETHFTGGAVLSDAVKQYLLRDLTILLVLAVLVIVVIYYLSFRAFRSAFLTLLIVGAGTLWSIGFMSLFGFTITIVSITTPPLVLTLGSSYSIHILNQYYRDSKNHPKERTKELGKGRLWIADSVGHVSRTILMAAATTVVGFMSLLATNLQPSKEFGIAASFGIISCAVLSFLLLPALLSFMRHPRPHQQKRVAEGFITKLMGKAGRFVIRRRIYITVFFGLIIAVFFLIQGNLKYETSIIDYFPKREKAVQDMNFIYKEMKGYDQFTITLTAPEGEKNYFLRPEVLAMISDFEREIMKYPDITKMFSFPSYLRYLNYVMTGEDRIPEARPLILLLSRYIKTLASEPEFQNMIGTMANEDFSRLDLIIWGYDHESESLSRDTSLAAMMESVQADMESMLDPALDPAMWGVTLKIVSISDLIKRDQQITTVLSLVLVFILTTLTFRSLRLGLISLVPLVTGVLLNFIFMVVFKIPMDMTTVMFSIVVIGVGVDNSIHFLLRFREQEKLYGDIKTILEHTLKIAGRPIIITTTSIIGGLLVLTFASFRPIIYFGLLVAVALFTAALGTLLILPAILTFGWKRRHPEKNSGR
jgi:uncharacterized protein